MEPEEELVRVVGQGSVEVNEAWVVASGDGHVLIGVDLKTKRFRVAGYNGSTIFLDTGEDDNEFTIIEFPQWHAWNVFCSEADRYSLSVALVAPETEMKALQAARGEEAYGP
jgi:uncharacterized protein (DUF736 family)